MTNAPEDRDVFDEIVNEVISDSISEQKKPKRAPIAASAVRLLTADYFVSPGLHVVETLPMIMARCVLGVNALKDMAIAARDLAGGRSKTLEGMIERAELEVINDLRQQAVVYGAQAIVCVRIQVSDLMEKGVCVIGHGTPLRLEAEQES